MSDKKVQKIKKEIVILPSSKVGVGFGYNGISAKLFEIFYQKQK